MRLPMLGMAFALLMPFRSGFAQESTAYRTPPPSMADVLLAAPTPSVSIDEKGRYMVLQERSSYPGIDELARPELRIAGLRIDPGNFGPSRSTYITGLRVKDLRTGAERTVEGLPQPLRAGGLVWNPSQTRLAFSHTAPDGIELWEMDPAAAKARKVSRRPMNNVLANFGYVDDETLLYFATVSPASSAPPRPAAPSGPTVQENLGKAAPVRTFQDMIRSAYDEELFAFYGTSQPVEIRNGKEREIGGPDLYRRMTESPDGRFFLKEVIRKPFSYQVPYSGFPRTVSITDRQGKVLRVLAELPSSETAPSGNDNVQDVPRGFGWRADHPAMVVWIKPLDGGLMKNQVAKREAVLSLKAPFTADPVEMARTDMRCRGVTWGNDTLALIAEGLQGKQLTRVSRLDPSKGTSEVLIERSVNDRYNDPGSPLTRRNASGQSVLYLADGGRLVMTGQGASPDGDLPFLAEFDLATKRLNNLWRCDTGYYENVVAIPDPSSGRFITSRQSLAEAPNFFWRTLGTKELEPITAFPDPQPALRGLKREKISYRRQDGVDLTATVYLPAGYDPVRDGRLPVLVWAYPREFKSAGDAAQVRGSKYFFTRISWGSPIFHALEGYAVMDAAEFPIVGEGDREPNDNFIEQLTWNAEAALRAAHEGGWGDTTRAAVGGHSYGAFMTANLLAHTRLFKAGLARSGAYLRYLTPFGFQNEERTYWEAPELYQRMSPFTYANNVKDALLLIHGEADNNPGTFPINSERLFQAVKGHGGTVRYVSLPHESHSYAAKESVLHMLWEQHRWMEEHVKGASGK